jgi:hypothetical protein
MIDQVASRIGDAAGQVLDIFQDEKIARLQTAIGKAFFTARSGQIACGNGSGGEATTIAGD